MAATEPYLISSEGQRPSVPFDGTVAGVLPHPNALVIRGFDGELAIARDEDLELIDTRTSTHAVTDDRVGWATMDGRVHASGPSAWSSSPGSRVHAMTWAAGDALLLAGRASGVLDAWTRSGRKVASVQAHDARIISLMVQPSNGHIVSVDVDGVVQWWEPSRLTGEEVPLVTNYRTCSGTQQVVPVVPFPTPETRWAPAQHCEAR